jgi:hypothetical protein
MRNSYYGTIDELDETSDESDAEFTDSEDAYMSSDETEESDLDAIRMLIHDEYEDSDENDSDYTEDEEDILAIGGRFT